VLAAQFVLGIYGGYFGGAVGLMMVAWVVAARRERSQGAETRRARCWSAPPIPSPCSSHPRRAVWWKQTLALLAGGLAGGYGGAHLGRIVPARVTRALTLCAAGGITRRSSCARMWWGEKCRRPSPPCGGGWVGGDLTAQRM